jgi:hypothetical protein
MLRSTTPIPNVAFHTSATMALSVFPAAASPRVGWRLKLELGSFLPTPTNARPTGHFRRRHDLTPRIGGVPKHPGSNQSFWVARWRVAMLTLRDPGISNFNVGVRQGGSGEGRTSTPHWAIR